jgi:hypothetical protein
MLLSVLSGEKPVSEAIAQAKISRGAYYQMETRALKAMLGALSPRAAGRAGRGTELSAAKGRIEKLQAQVRRLEQDKRRTQRLLLLARKSFWMPLKARRTSKSARRGSSPNGKRGLRNLAKVLPNVSSMPMRAGESVP